MKPVRGTIRSFLSSLTACIVLACLYSGEAKAQTVGLGFGLGLPLLDYFTDEVDREYRVTPSPGYYPVLKSLQNAPGSLHLNVNVLLPMDGLGILDEIEVRFDVSRFRWKTSKVTHTACRPVDVYNGTFNDASVEYVPLKDALKEDGCLSYSTDYHSTSDISSDERSSLWFFHISGGGRWNFLRLEEWRGFLGAHLGLTISSTLQSGPWFGGNMDLTLGAAYQLSPLVWLEIDARLLFLVTQVPEDSQLRINHETRTGGNIFTSLVQPYAYLDLQVVIRFDISEL